MKIDFDIDTIAFDRDGDVVRNGDTDAVRWEVTSFAGVLGYVVEEEMEEGDFLYRFESASPDTVGGHHGSATLDGAIEALARATLHAAMNFGIRR